MALDLRHFRQAVVALEEAVAVSQDDDFVSQLNSAQERTIQAGVMQHFEFTYELAWKLMQRWLRINRGPGESEPRTRKDLFRNAARAGLIADPIPWFRYAEARNTTSHTYNASVSV
ncbi:MAG: HI0074 family nucleotidyltransferase substrate-binding subunit, partial [Polyangiales bacterium]